MNRRRTEVNIHEWAYLIELWAGLLLLVVGVFMITPDNPHSVWVTGDAIGIFFIIHAGIFGPGVENMAKESRKAD